MTQYPALVHDAKRNMRRFRKVELHALIAAAIAELCERDGVPETRAWMEIQSARLSALDPTTTTAP